MNSEEQDLYRRICNFKLDAPNALFPFSHKLSWECRWTEIYTLRAIQEYKKFIFLAMVADHIVSPPEPIDKVWHLHLLYSHSYWHQFCGELLHKELHHSPSSGGHKEEVKYLHLYQQTLETYQHYFGTPPQDIWPDPNLRGKPIAFHWVDSHQYWIIPKPGQWLSGLYQLFLKMRLLMQRLEWGAR